MEGTRERDWRQIVQDAEGRGITLEGSGGYEALGLSADGLVDDWEQMLVWMAELVREATFPEDRLRWVGNQGLAELLAQEDQPEEKASWAFLGQLYGGHPRGRPLPGTRESLEALDRESCSLLLRRSLGWGAILTVAGAVPEQRTVDTARSLFSFLPNKPGEPPTQPLPENPAIPRLELQLDHGEQAHLYLGHITIARTHEDWPALQLLSVILGAGAGLSGRVPERVREQEGLAYDAHASAVAGAGLDPGHLSLYAGTSVERLAQAEAAMREELERLINDGIEERELLEARSFLLGREPFRRETVAQRAGLLAESELLGQPVDRPEWLPERLLALDRAAVEEAARRHIDPQRLRVTVAVPGGKA